MFLMDDSASLLLYISVTCDSGDSQFPTVICIAPDLNLLYFQFFDIKYSALEIWLLQQH